MKDLNDYTLEVHGCHAYDAIRLKCFAHQPFHSRTSNNSLRNLGTYRVVLVRGQCHGSQDTDDRHHDHQFDQGKTLLEKSLHEKPPREKLEIRRKSSIFYAKPIF